MTKSVGKCFCGKRGDNIHHLDEIPSNNDFDNLILLCYDHHHDASVKNGLKKKFTIKQLKKLRDEAYKHNDEKRRIELKHYGTTLKKISEENLFRAALDASIVMEIIKVKSEFKDEGDWDKRYDIIYKLRKYSEYHSIRISHEVFRFFLDVSEYTRADMPASISHLILNSILEFFPYSENLKKDKKVILEISKTCGHIAFGISYDAFIHLCNLAVAGPGLEILKHLYTTGKRLEMPEISAIALKKYSELERTLQRPERNDLENAKCLLKAYKDDLDKPGLRMPDDIPDDLYHLMMEHSKISRQRVIIQD